MTSPARNIKGRSARLSASYNISLPSSRTHETQQNLTLLLVLDHHHHHDNIFIVRPRAQPELLLLVLVGLRVALVVCWIILGKRNSVLELLQSLYVRIVSLSVQIYYKVFKVLRLTSV